MKIYLVRHGEQDLNSSSKGLSDKGIKDAKFLRSYIDSEKLRFDLVLSSPVTRAKETAEILHSSPKLAEELSPNADPRVAYEIIPKTGTILVVSHLPLLEELSELLGEGITFEPATMAYYDDDGLEKILIPS